MWTRASRTKCRTAIALTLPSTNHHLNAEVSPMAPWEEVQTHCMLSWLAELIPTDLLTQLFWWPMILTLISFQATPVPWIDWLREMALVKWLNLVRRRYCLLCVVLNLLVFYGWERISLFFGKASVCVASSIVLGECIVWRLFQCSAVHLLNWTIESKPPWIH